MILFVQRKLLKKQYNFFKKLAVRILRRAISALSLERNWGQLEMCRSSDVGMTRTKEFTTSAMQYCFKKKLFKNALPLRRSKPSKKRNSLMQDLIVRRIFTTIKVKKKTDIKEVTKQVTQSRWTRKKVKRGKMMQRRWAKKESCNLKMKSRIALKKARRAGPQLQLHQWKMLHTSLHFTSRKNTLMS